MTNMNNTKNIFVSSRNLNDVPIEDGQLIALKDSDALLYDIDGVRHSINNSDMLLDSINNILEKYEQSPVSDMYNALITLDNLCKFNYMQTSVIDNQCGMFNELRLILNIDTTTNYNTLDDLPEYLEWIKPLCKNPDYTKGEHYVMVCYPVKYLTTVNNTLETVQPYIDTYDFINIKWFNYAFYHSDVESIPYLKNLHPIMMYNTFKECRKLVDISNLNELAKECIFFNYCFYACTNLTSVELNAPQGIFFNYCFHSCTNLTSVELNAPQGIFFNYCFHSCTNLTSVELNAPQGINIYLDSCFYYCTNLTSVKLNINQCYKLDYCFYNCINLTSIIGELDFSNATYYQSFRDCSKLQDIRFKENSISSNIDFKESMELTQDSLNSIIDGLATSSSKRYISLPSSIISSLSSDQSDKLLDKNWYTR